MAEKPTRQPAAGPRIGKAPTTGHPARPAPEHAPGPDASEPEQTVDAPAPSTPAPAAAAEPSLRPALPVRYTDPAPDLDPLVPLGGRVRQSTRRRLRVFVAVNELNQQDVIDEALARHLDEHGG